MAHALADNARQFVNGIILDLIFQRPVTQTQVLQKSCRATGQQSLDGYFVLMPPATEQGDDRPFGRNPRDPTFDEEG